jgi:uncharacterized protein YdeI (YjbR/CyaY-like superfamily)
MEPTFFATPLELRKWLKAHHATAQELLVGFYKRDSGKPSITWPESVDEALCVGWIDGIRKRVDESSFTIRFTPRKPGSIWKRVDESSFTIRFTPRKPGSIWSAVNIKRVEKLSEAGLMQPAGLAAFAKRKEARSAVYAYEQRGKGLSAEYEQKLKANRKAWAFYQAQPPWYQRTSAWWVISAKREETRLKRLEQLIDDSARGRTIRSLTRAKNT